MLSQHQHQSWREFKDFILIFTPFLQVVYMRQALCFTAVPAFFWQIPYQSPPGHWCHDLVRPLSLDSRTGILAKSDVPQPEYRDTHCLHSCCIHFTSIFFGWSVFSLRRSVMTVINSMLETASICSLKDSIFLRVVPYFPSMSIVVLCYHYAS